MYVLASMYAREQERKKMPHVMGFSKGFSQFSSKTKGGPHTEPLENNGPVTRIALAAQTTIIITFWPHVCWCRQLHNDTKKDQSNRKKRQFQFF